MSPEEALQALGPQRRAELTAGASGWSTVAAPEVGLAAMVMGDGPLGLVSHTFDERDTALLLPCGTALGATWDPERVAAVALAQASEALRRGYAAVYSPNLNLARTGLSGRTFEMYSEDPELAGLLGAAFVTAMQSQGVASCPKHLVANDTETERQRMSAQVDERTLREVYLRPFELALRGAGAWAVMAAYNRLNGVPCTAHPELLAVVKEEWGWDGMVISDYFALGDTLGPATAGLDLEMPGPAIHLGARFGAAVTDGDVPAGRLDDAVLRQLRLASRVGALGDGPAADPTPPGYVPAEAGPGLLAEVAASSFVVLRNEGDLLPLSASAGGRLAVVGPNASRPTYQGATFGRVRPAGVVATPLDAVRDRFGGSWDVVHEVGVARTRLEPLGGFATTTPAGEPGVLLEHLPAGGGEPVLSEVRADTAFIWFGAVPGVGPTTAPGVLRLTAVLTPTATGVHRIGAGGSGETVVRVDGVVVATRPAPAPGDVMGQVARAETTDGEVELTAGRPVTVEVEMTSAGARVQALTVGLLTPQPDGVLERAVQAAASADAVVLVVGDVLETSRESRDLPSSGLPPEQVELVRRVAAANPRTVVLLNAGRPVHTPWADDVAALVQTWLPGQGFGDAVAAVLAGDAEPSGRMPVTVPVADEDRSTWGVALDEDLALDYTGTEPTGYRDLQRRGRAPRFAFGSGLGWTTWAHGDARVDDLPDGGAQVTVTVRNTGRRRGREVVQVYVRAPGETDARLAGFAGVRVDPGGTAEVTVPSTRGPSPGGRPGTAAGAPRRAGTRCWWVGRRWT